MRLSVTLAKAGEVQWGDVATWLSSVATLAAVLAALVAVLMQRQEFRLAQRQGRQAQASGVSAELSSAPRESAGGHRVWEITVHNASAAPIFGCALMSPRSDGVMARMNLGTIAAGQSSTHRTTHDPGALGDLGFTDSEGRFWVRRWTGSLISVPLPPGALIIGGPQAFDIAEYLDPRPPGLEKSPEVVIAVETWARTTGLLNLRKARRHRDKGLLP